jgi:hypothetical protein
LNPDGLKLSIRVILSLTLNPKNMSNKKSDKGKLYHKLHQLQKRMTRMTVKDGHSEGKLKVRQSRINELIQAIRGSGRRTRPAF